MFGNGSPSLGQDVPYEAQLGSLAQKVNHAPTTASETPVSREAHRLEALVKTAHECISILEGKLQPILKPDCPSTAKGEQRNQAMGSPLAHFITENNDLLEALCSRIVALQVRVDL